jgi:alkanesulfonate monooxygenase SsuD/methylene tetrahydromethanopterin reductase-like flavin-dependent oxidoreductase (luciferase family)
MTVTNRFRFGVVATPRSAEQWVGAARRAAGFGYDTLLMPDNVRLPAPLPSLAIAAGAADIGVGSWVLAAPLRPPRLLAWEAHTLTVLTGGRFELGVGTGLPAVAEQARALGVTVGAGNRLDLVAQLIDAVREHDADGPRTPVLMAAAGPRALALAAARADIVTLAVGALTPRDEVAARVDQLRGLAGDRADDIELAAGLFVVGDELSAEAQRYVGADLAELRAVESLVHVRGSAREMADELLHRRDRLGISYWTVPDAFTAQFAPVLELLAGR